MNGRMYDPIIGRMLSPDIVVPDATNTQSYNRYSYVFNNPLKYTDADGNCPICVIIVVAVIVGAYAGGAAANGTTDPTMWDYHSNKTWEYMGIGGAIGGLAAVTGGGAVAGLGLVGVEAGIMGGMVGGMVGGAGFAGLQSNWDAGQMLKGAVIGGFAGALGGGIGAGVGGAFGGSLAGQMAGDIVGGAAGGAAGGFVAGGMQSGTLEGGLEAAKYGAIFGGATGLVSAGARGISAYRSNADARFLSRNNASASSSPRKGLSLSQAINKVQNPLYRNILKVGYKLGFISEIPDLPTPGAMSAKIPRFKGSFFRGGSKAVRDTFYGINDKKFINWWHGSGKQSYGGLDIMNRNEAMKIYHDWLEMGSPR